mmetsp:Transcript_22516/g.42461  ORF Transcript_22516/g.42461 Transcript_22516/m.42461 type:complete len:297 (+) Transcript_22516:51-941(+)
MSGHNGEAGDGEEVTTVFVAGFPPDASSREMDNLCRFFPGFVRSKANFGRGLTLFALFDSVGAAEAAIDALNDQAFDQANPSEVLRAVMAKSNMRKAEDQRGRDNTIAAPNKGVFGGKGSFGASKGGGAKGGGGKVGTPSAPRFSAYSRNAYDSRPGYESRSPQAPVAAPAYTRRPAPTGQKGSYGGGGGYGGGSKGALGASPWEPPAKRPRSAAPAGSIDTVISMGALEAGFDEDAIHGFYAGQPGFTAFKANHKLGHFFAKFDTPENAAQAVEVAMSEAIPAEMARSNMKTELA